MVFRSRGAAGFALLRAALSAGFSFPRFKASGHRVVGKWSEQAVPVFLGAEARALAVRLRILVDTVTAPFACQTAAMHLQMAD